MYDDCSLRDALSLHLSGEQQSNDSTMEFMDYYERTRSMYVELGYKWETEQTIINRIQYAAALTKYRMTTDKQIIWINGQSGSGKTTLEKKLRDMSLDALIIDLDNIHDRIPRSDKDTYVARRCEDLISIIKNDDHHNIICVGLPVPLFGLADYMYAVDTNCRTRYIQQTRRELSAICSNVNRYMDELHDTPDMVARLEKLNTSVQNRGLDITPTDKRIEGRCDQIRLHHKASGFILLPSEEIINKILALLTPV
jgi:hypothetical protein